MDVVTAREPKAKPVPAEHAQLLQDMRDEFLMSEAATSEQRTNELDDLEFEGGKHWKDADLLWRTRKQKPAFTMDQLSGPIQKATNQPVHRMVIIPSGGGADPKTAEMWQGYCRRIENLSNAEGVYRWGRMHAIKMGRGFWRVRADVFDLPDLSSETFDPSVFNQDIRIEPILNQHSVYEDPRPRLLDFSDARFGIITEDLEWSAFTRVYPEAQWTSLSQFEAVGDCPPNWATPKHIRVAERYYIVDEKVTLCRLVTGEVVRKVPGKTYPKDQITKERIFHVPTVMWFKASATEIIDGPKRVPGRYIPIVKIVGERRIINGVTDYRGLVRMSKDPQRLVDFMESRLAETVDTAAFSTIMAATPTVAQYESEWATINTDRPALVHYDPVADVTGKMMPPPAILQSSPDIAGIAIAAQRAGMQLRHNLGVPDVTPDEKKPEQSGKAIQKRLDEQAQATSHYGEGTADGVRHTGRIILSMAREILDVPQVLRITGNDEKPLEVVPYKGEGHRPAAEAMAREGVDPNDAAALRQMFRTDVGSFDITVKAGKGTDSGRQEAREGIEMAVTVFPPAAEKLLPIYFKNSDFPGAAEAAKSMEPGDGQQPIPPKVQQRLEQLDQYAQLATDELKKLQQERDAKTLDNASKEKIALAELDVKLQIAKMQELTKLQLAELELKKLAMQAEIDAQQAALGQAHEVGMAGAAKVTADDDAEREAERGMAAGDIEHQRAMEMGEQGHRQNLEAIKAKPQPNGSNA